MTLRSYIVNYLDPNFVREEELALLIDRKTDQLGSQSVKPKRIRYKDHLDLGDLLTLTVPAGKIWTNLDMWVYMVYGAASPSFFFVLRIYPQDAAVSPAINFLIDIDTQAATTGVRRAFFSQGIDEYRSIDHTAVGGLISNLIPIPKILLEENMRLQFTIGGGVGDMADFILYYTEVDA